MSKRARERELISFDWALKRLLRQKANHDILEGFLSELLQFDVKVVSLLESESNKEQEDDKSNRVDLLCKNHLGELALIEVQYYSEIDYFQRMLFGVSKLIVEYLKEGDAYAEVKKVYSINILYFDLGQGEDYVYHGFTSFKGIHTNDELQLGGNQKVRFAKRMPSELYPEYYILKINTFDSIAKSSLDEWIYYLKNDKLPERYHAKGLKEVDKKLKLEKMKPSERKQYNQFWESVGLSRSGWETALMEGRMKGMLEGRAEGKAEGKAETIKETVLRAKEEGLSNEVITKITGLPEEEVLEIINFQ